MDAPPVKILLVDDDEDDFIITRDLISQIKDRAYELTWVDNGAAALEKIRRQSHDICLIDYRLGEMTGLDILKETQSLVNRPPMILLTGQGDHEIDVEATRTGAADYLIKGQLNSDKLERAIRYALQRKRAEERLRRELDLTSRIMETISVGIAVTDRHGRITFANHEAETILGLTKEQIDQKTYSVLDWRMTDRDGKPVSPPIQPLNAVLHTGEPVQNIRHLVERRGGHRVLLSTNATPLYDTAERIDGMVVAIDDITEQMALEAQLRQAQKMESVGQLAAGVAHDINNVLTVIQGHTGLLLYGAEPGGDTANSLEQISAACERAASFIRQLLTFSRKQVVQTKSLDLNATLKNLHAMLPRLLGEDITVETNYHPDLPPLLADTGMMEQIVINLVVNSRDAMPKGGKLTIATSLHDINHEYVRHHTAARVGRFVCISVADTGCGMDATLLERIFEPFFTTKEVGRGTGLGLATVYGIVRQHEGWIDVQSQVGAGTTFHVFLPVEQTVPTTHTTVSSALDRPESVQGGQETILFVEDEHGLLELGRAVLCQYNYRVHTATSGTEALRVWEETQGNIDLLVTDMIMPGGMTGGELAAELKKRKTSLQVLYTSGYSSELDGKDFGHCDSVFLPKPYNPAQLAKKVRESLDTSASPASEVLR